MESWILSAEPVSPAPVSRIAAPDFDEHTCAHTHARTDTLTVNLVSHVHGFFPGGRLAIINTSLESSWSPILISVAFDCNRVHLDELDQVIVGAVRNIN